MIEWLRLRVPSAGGTGSVPGQGIKILHAVRCGKKNTSLPLLKRILRAHVNFCHHHAFPLTHGVRRGTR